MSIFVVYQANSLRGPGIALSWRTIATNANETAIYVYGGRDTSIGENNFNIYDFNSSAWGYTGGPSYIFGHAAATNKAKTVMYNFGGKISSSLSNIMNILYMTNNTWAAPISGYSGSVIPNARYFHSAVMTSDDILVVHGGVTTYNPSVVGSSVLNDLFLYDYRNNSWSQVYVGGNGAPSSGRFGHSAVITSDDIMILFGGEEQNL
jgi:hypothetical protein